MKQKLSLFILALFTTLGAWAAVTQPTLTTDPSNPTYYVIQNYRSGKYANYAGASAQLQQVASADAGATSLWYFMANGSGVSIIPATAPSLKLASTNSATAEGAVWYLPENPYKAGVFCVSLTSGATANCWDDQGSHTTIGYWQPAANDNEGTSWNIIEVAVSKAEVDAGTVDLSWALIKSDVQARLAPLSSLSVYTAANIAAVRNASDMSELNAALTAFETNISLYCRSNNYLVVGESACSYVASPTGYEEVIQLVSAGSGNFYLKGYKSEKYVGDVQISTAITTDATPTTAFYFESYNGYTVVRPSNTASSYDGYRYIHNGGSGCVGWSADGANTQHTIAEVELPAEFVNVTYHLMVDNVDKAQATVECGVGDAPDAAGIFTYPYTTLLSYDVATIASNTTDVYVTATFNLPFTLSTDFANATWHYATLRGKYLRADDSAKDGSGRYQTNASNEHTDAYKWAFFGNPVDGIYVMNKNQGSGKYLYQDTQFNFTSLADPTADNHALFAVTPNSNGGFTLRSISGGATYYVNDAGNGGNIGFWDSSTSANDGGSNWLVEDVATSDKAALGEAIAAAQALVAAPGVPGYPSAEATATLSSAITTAQGVYDDASGDYYAAYTTLNAAIATAKDAIVYTPRTDVYYTITSDRGSMVYDSSHDSSEDAEGNKFLWYTTNLDNTNVNHLWGFIEQDGNYYMYNVGKQQFATVTTSGSYQLNDRGTWAFSDTPAYVTFDAGINNSVAAPYVRVRATVATTGTTYSMSISPSYIGPVITYDAQGDGGIPMLLAESSVPVDASITAAMTAKVEDLTPYYTALQNAIDACSALNIGTGLNQYGSNSTYEAALAAANTTVADTDATKSDLQTATSNLESALAGLTLNLPTEGFYRIKGKTSGKYLAAGFANNKFAMSDATDATTIFYYDGTKLTNFSTGMCNGMTASAWSWVTGDNASAVEFQDGQTNGGYAVLSSNAYFYDGGTSADRGSSLGSDAQYRSWYLEEVTTLPVTIASVLYATLYAPVALTIPSGVEAYYISSLSDTEATLTEVETTIAANTPVILKATNVAGTYNFVATTGGTDVSASNKLEGQLAAFAVSDDDITNNVYYTLQQNVAGNAVGLFPKTGATKSIAGFKAYLPASNLPKSASVKGFDFIFDDDATGIKNLNDLKDSNDLIYNVAGQRLQKMQKGINIVNGKKVMK